MFNNLSEKLDKALHVLKGHGSITEVNVAETLKEENLTRERCYIFDKKYVVYKHDEVEGLEKLPANLDKIINIKKPKIAAATVNTDHGVTFNVVAIVITDSPRRIIVNKPNRSGRW